MMSGTLSNSQRESVNPYLSSHFNSLTQNQTSVDDVKFTFPKLAYLLKTNNNVIFTNPTNYFINATPTSSYMTENSYNNAQISQQILCHPNVEKFSNPMLYRKSINSNDKLIKYSSHNDISNSRTSHINHQKNDLAGNIDQFGPLNPNACGKKVSTPRRRLKASKSSTLLNNNTKEQNSVKRKNYSLNAKQGNLIHPANITQHKSHSGLVPFTTTKLSNKTISSEVKSKLLEYLTRRKCLAANNSEQSTIHSNDTEGMKVKSSNALFNKSSQNKIQQLISASSKPSPKNHHVDGQRIQNQQSPKRICQSFSMPSKLSAASKHSPAKRFNIPHQTEMTKLNKANILLVNSKQKISLPNLSLADYKDVNLEDENQPAEDKNQPSAVSVIKLNKRWLSECMLTLKGEDSKLLPLETATIVNTNFESNTPFHISPSTAQAEKLNDTRLPSYRQNTVYNCPDHEEFKSNNLVVSSSSNSFAIQALTKWNSTSILPSHKQHFKRTFLHRYETNLSQEDSPKKPIAANGLNNPNRPLMGMRCPFDDNIMRKTNSDPLLKPTTNDDDCHVAIIIENGGKDDNKPFCDNDSVNISLNHKNLSYFNSSNDYRPPPTQTTQGLRMSCNSLQTSHHDECSNERPYVTNQTFNKMPNFINHTRSHEGANNFFDNVLTDGATLNSPWWQNSLCCFPAIPYNAIPNNASNLLNNMSSTHLWNSYLANYFASRWFANYADNVAFNNNHIHNLTGMENNMYYENCKHYLDSNAPNCRADVKQHVTNQTQKSKSNQDTVKHAIKQWASARQLQNILQNSPLPNSNQSATNLSSVNGTLPKKNIIPKMRCRLKKKSRSSNKISWKTGSSHCHKRRIGPHTNQNKNPDNHVCVKQIIKERLAKKLIVLSSSSNDINLSTTPCEPKLWQTHTEIELEASSVLASLSNLPALV